MGERECRFRYNLFKMENVKDRPMIKNQGKRIHLQTPSLPGGMTILVDSDPAVKMSLILGVKVGRFDFAVDEIRLPTQQHDQREKSESQCDGQSLNA